MEIKGFIFDLDGVLTDTAEYHYHGWKRLADEEGIPFTRAENEALRGIPRRASLMVLLKGRTRTCRFTAVFTRRSICLMTRSLLDRLISQNQEWESAVNQIRSW